MKPILLEFVIKGQVDKELKNVQLAIKGVGDESYTSFRKLSEESDNAGLSVKKLAAGMGIAFSAVQAKNFIKEMVNIRSEFQNTEASFRVFLGSAEKAGSFMKEIQRYAFNNVFEFKDLTKQASQLLAFGHELENIIPIIDKISNIAAGANVPLEQLVDLYNKAKSQGKLMSQDIQQWQRAGVPLIQELSKQFNVTEQAMWSMVSTGKVGFKEVDTVLNTLTSSGGMFAGIMEEKMKTLGDSVGLLQDSITAMFNELGERSENVLRAGILTANALVENYETVGKILLSLVSTYGAYRVALALSTVAASKHTMAEIIRIRTLVAARKAQQLLNASMLTNPYVLVTTAVVGLVSAFILLNKGIKSTGEIIDSLQQSTNDYDRSVKTLTGDLSRYEELQKKAKTEAGLSETEHRDLNTIMERLIQTVPNLQAEFDEYGNVLSVNVLQIKQFTDAHKKAYKDILENDLQLANQRKKQLENQMETYRKTFQDGQYLETFNVMVGITANETPLYEKRTRYVDATEKQKQQARDKWKEAQTELIDLNKQITESTNLLNGIISSGTNPDPEVITQNKEHWEGLKKAAQTALNEMDASLVGSREWLEQKKIIKEANEKLKLYEVSEKADNREEKNRQKRLDAEQKLTEKTKAIADERLRVEMDLEQKRIDLIEDSFFKRTLQNELNYKKELLSIGKHADDTLKALQEAERLDWEKNGSKGVFKLTIETLPEEYEEEIRKLKDVALSAFKQNEAQIAIDLGDVWQEERLRFASELNIRLADIEKFYRERLKMAEGNEELIAELMENQQIEIQQTYADHALAMIDFDTRITLRKMEISKKFYLFETDRRKELVLVQKKAVQQELEVLSKLYDQAPTEELARQIKEAETALFEFNAELDRMPVDRLREGLSILKAITSELGGLNGEIGTIFSNISGQVDNIMTAFDDTATTVDKVSAGVSGLVNVINMVTSASSKRKKAQVEFYRNSIALAHEYALALNEQLRLQSELNGSGFLSDYTGRITDAFDAMTDATRGYNEAVAKLSDGKAKIDLRNAVDWGNVGKGAASGAAVGAAIGSVVPVIGTAVGAVVGAIGGFFSGLFGGKKKKTKYAGLLEVFPELVDEAGNLNKELAQSIVNTNQVDENTKQLIQNALEWAEAVEEAREQIRDIVVDLAGDLGNNLKSAIIDAWKAGEDASKNMFEVAGESLEKFVEDLLYSTIFADIFKEFEDRLVDSLDPGGGDGDILDDYDWLMEQMQKEQDTYTALLEAFKERANQRGYEMWQPEEADTVQRATSTKGITVATQDSVDKAYGCLTAILMHVSKFNDDATNIGNYLFIGVNHLAAIEDNTSYCRRLEGIEDTLKAMQRDGIKVK